MKLSTDLVGEQVVITEDSEDHHKEGIIRAAYVSPTTSDFWLIVELTTGKLTKKFFGGVAIKHKYQKDAIKE